MNHQRVYKALCIHWDHHPESDAQHYGAGTDANQIRQYLQMVQPDVTQYHTIGCYGYASFPSHVAPVVPGLHNDPLRIWADTCSELGVPFGCYAAAFDCRSPVPVPQWRTVNRAGLISEHDYCPNGPWTEAFFIPFLLEVMDRYHPVHFWLDGVWLPSDRANYCFCEYCQQRFARQYGRSMPVSPAPSDWIDLQEFHERSLDEAVGRIGRTIKGHDPSILLACNSLYFFKDGRRPVPEVDWVSWDVLNTPNLHRASFESTYLSTVGKPADIMIYDQGIVRWQPDLLRRSRPLAQLYTEAGILLAHGIRVNLWHDPLPDGSILADKARIAQQVAHFVRQRQEWCVDNESFAEVAVLASRLDHLSNSHHQEMVVRAIQQALQEAHIPCDVVHDDVLLNRLVQYHLVILPETEALNLDTAQWLHQYVQDGGGLLIIAARPIEEPPHWHDALFGENMGFQFRTEPDGALKGEAGMQGTLSQDGEFVPLGHHRYDLLGNWRSLIPYTDETPALAELTIGDGRILIITGEVISEYAQSHWPPLRSWIARAVYNSIGSAQQVEMSGHPGIELVVNRRGNDLYVHLVNLTPGTSFGSSDEVFFDEVPTCRDIQLVVRPPRRPTDITLLPDQTSPPTRLVNGECRDTDERCTLYISIPELTYHCAIRLTGAIGENSPRPAMS